MNKLRAVSRCPSREGPPALSLPAKAVPASVSGTNKGDVVEANIQLIAEFLARIPDLPEYLLSLGMMLMFAHGVRAGQSSGFHHGD